MAEFAIVDNDVIVDFRAFDVAPVLVGKPYRKILPVVTTDPPLTDASTQIKTGPVVTLEADRVTKVYTVRPKTAPEISAEKDQKLDALDLLIFKVLFNHENRIRTLEGLGAITQPQFRAALKAML